MASARTRAYYLSFLPGKQLVSRATLVLLITGGMMLMVMGKAHNPGVEKFRNTLADTITPVLAVAARPIDSIMEGGQWLVQMSTLHADNVALTNQNLQLKEWQSIAKEMEAENRALRSLLKVVPGKAASYVTARVVSDIGGPYVHSALVDGGQQNGVLKDHAVINDKGLVGRVVESGDKSARVLLLTDINSRVPVMAENSYEKSILMGNNGDTLTLSYLSTDSRLAVGDRIVTSGDGGVFPKGIPVGVIASVEGGIVKVQPFVDASRLEYVSVVDFSLK